MPDSDQALISDDPQAVIKAVGASLLDAVPAAILVVDQTGRIIYGNSEVSRLFGYELAELIGQQAQMLMAAESRAEGAFVPQLNCDQLTQALLGDGRELTGLCKDGGQFPLEIGVRAFNTGQQQWLLVSILDNSERKKAQQQLATVIDASPYGKLVVDKTGVIRMVNHRVVELFGYTKAHLLGQPLKLLLPERYRDGHSSMVHMFFSGPSLRAMGEGRDLTGRHCSGREIPLEIGLAPLDFAGELHVLVCITDITRRKRLEADLREANAQLEEFTFVVSHDLKSPLRGIADLTDWILEDLGESPLPAVANNLQRIQTRIVRMENLTEDLLQYARAAKRSTDVSQVNALELVKGILELLTMPAGAQVDLNFAITELIAAKTPLETVLRNLISNAIKHHGGERQLHLSVCSEAAGSYCCIRVQDNGPGIPHSARERVFRLFQTLNGSSTELGGVGLALAKRLTEAHGGRLELDNPAGQIGCCFVLWWPRFARSDLDG